METSNIREEMMQELGIKFKKEEIMKENILHHYLILKL